MSKKLKNRIFEIVQASSTDDLSHRAFEIFIMTLVLLNVFAVILETVDSLSSQFAYFFHIFDVFSVLVFTIEYLLRLWVCTIDERYKRPIKGRIRFATTPLAIVDILAILPFYLPMLIPFDLRFIRALRLFRLFRLFKIGRYSDAFRTLENIIKSKKEELLISVFSVMVLLVISSSMMYYVENEAQPDTFSSIPDAMWWGVSTLTTVGYGDVIPITTFGKIFGSIIALLGIGMFALPTGILASGFAEEIRKKGKGKQICPHCGKDIDKK
ncbi:MAG: ion transporter [Thermoplasmatota archaeon]